MHDWQHTLASWLLAGALFLLVGGMTAPLSGFVWRMRHRMSLPQLKNALAVITLLPPAVAVLSVATSPISACAQQMACYVGWLHANVGEVLFPTLRLVVLGAGLFLAFLFASLIYRGFGALRALRSLHAFSKPPSKKLLGVMEQVVPSQWHGRFREAEMPNNMDGVYGGTCVLSRQTVRDLDGAQLKAVVAHEWQHLRARDGWFALLVGILVSGVRVWGWAESYRRWSHSAELLADSRAAHEAVTRTQLARTLLQRQAQAQGIAVGFGTSGELLEERLHHLLRTANDTPSAWSSWAVWVLMTACAGWLFYTLWQTGQASTCTIHCVLF